VKYVIRIFPILKSTTGNSAIMSERLAKMRLQRPEYLRILQQPHEIMDTILILGRHHYNKVAIATGTSGFGHANADKNLGF